MGRELTTKDLFQQVKTVVLNTQPPNLRHDRHSLTFVTGGEMIKRKHANANGSRNCGASLPVKAIVARVQGEIWVQPQAENEGAREQLELPPTLVRQLLSHWPNDLSRVVYLTSLRDYNTGTYLHPLFSRLYGLSPVHKALYSYHRDLFSNLLKCPVEEYVRQLRGYIRYTGNDRTTLVTVWKSLEAYRAVIPLQISQESARLFFLNVRKALAWLGAEAHEIDPRNT
jgi:hypothetical protein